MTIQIEICKMGYNNKWRIRTGDVAGSSELSNIDKKTLMKEIKAQIELEEDGERNEI